MPLRAAESTESVNASLQRKEGKVCIISLKVFICDIYKSYRFVFSVPKLSEKYIYMSQCETGVQVKKYRNDCCIVHGMGRSY